MTKLHQKSPFNNDYATQKKGKTGVGRIIKALGYSKDGLMVAYRNEAAFRQVVWINGMLLVLLVFSH